MGIQSMQRILISCYEGGGGGRRRPKKKAPLALPAPIRVLRSCAHRSLLLLPLLLREKERTDRERSRAPIAPRFMRVISTESETRIEWMSEVRPPLYAHHHYPPHRRRPHRTVSTRARPLPAAAPPRTASGKEVEGPPRVIARPPVHSSHPRLSPPPFTILVFQGRPDCIAALAAAAAAGARREPTQRRRRRSCYSSRQFKGQGQDSIARKSTQGCVNLHTHVNK